MLKYRDLVRISKNLKIGLSLDYVNNDPGFSSLKMSNHAYPWSLKENEAAIVYNLILKNNLKYGFEIATGFGMSAIVMGQALRLTDGKMVSMDAYVEELVGYNKYDENTQQIKQKPDGHLIATELANVLGLKNQIDFFIGWSPKDTHTAIHNTHGNKRLDFAFIDGGHSSGQVYLDVISIVSRMCDDSLLMFHDHGSVCNKTMEVLKAFGYNDFFDYKTDFGLVAYRKGNIRLLT